MDKTSFKTICDCAVANLVPPDAVTRMAAGLPSREPFLLQWSDLSQSEKDKTRYLGILAALYKGSKWRFENVAPSVRGTKRTYFALSASEVASTGNSNWPERIPGSPWWVTVNNAGNRKRSIVYDLMIAMQFFPDYAYMVSSLCESAKPSLPWHYFTTLRDLKV